jgi:hypothetical protein
VRSINLLKLALDAEVLRLRAMMARQGRRAAFGSIALVFALAVLALAEIAGWQGLRLRVEAIPTTLILLGISRRWMRRADLFLLRLPYRPQLRCSASTVVAGVEVSGCPS